MCSGLSWGSNTPNKIQSHMPTRAFHSCRVLVPNTPHGHVCLLTHLAPLLQLTLPPLLQQWGWQVTWHHGVLPVQYPFSQHDIIMAMSKDRVSYECMPVLSSQPLSAQACSTQSALLAGSHIFATLPALADDCPNCPLFYNNSMCFSWCCRAPAFLHVICFE